MADLPAGWIESSRGLPGQFPKTLAEIDRLLTGNQIHIGRHAGRRRHQRRTMRSTTGFTGPNLRAAGVDPTTSARTARTTTTRRTTSRSPIGEHGDCYDRYLCRMEEMTQSVGIIRGRRSARLPGGPINVEDPNISLPSKTDAMSDMESMIHHFKLITEGIPAPEGDCYMAIEASKGELGMYVVAEEGGTKPVRWRVRPPSFVNLSVIPKLAEGISSRT